MKNQTQITSLLELTNAFPDDNSCRKYFEQIRWNNKPICPHCNYTEKIYRFKGGKLFKCGKCKKQFTATVGTIFEGSHIPLKKMVLGNILI